MVDHAGTGDKGELDLPGQKIHDHRRIAAVGHMDGVEPGTHAEILHRQMPRNSDAAAAVGDRLLPRRRGLGEGDEFLH